MRIASGRAGAGSTSTPGVYATTARLTHVGRALAAVLACGPGADRLGAALATVRAA